MFRAYCFSALLVWFCMGLSACHHAPDVTSLPHASVEKNHLAAAYNVQLGLAYLKQGHLPRARQKLLNALELAPDLAAAHSAMGYYMEALGEMDRAKTYYEKALRMAPHSGVQLNNYGTFLCKSKRYRESIPYFMQAVADVSYVNSAGAYENAGLCAMMIPDIQRAKAYFEKAIAHDPERTQSRQELANIHARLKQASALAT